MKIAMVVPPWIKIPPAKYGGIEVTVDLLTEGLVAKGHEVTLFSVGESVTNGKLFKFYETEQREFLDSNPTDFFNVLATHTLAAYSEIAQADFDIVHDHTWKEGLLCAKFINTPVVHTLHGPMNKFNQDFYHHFINQDKNKISFVTISDFQRLAVPELNYAATIYNGILLDKYPYNTKKDDYFFFIGRFNPEKAPHLACAVAKKLGVKLILAGKIAEKQEREYFSSHIMPYLGKKIEYIGELGHWSKEKMELLANGRGYLYPIQWEEPFGITMVEAMACGSPVFTLKRGSTAEVVAHGITGFVNDTIEELTGSVYQIDKIDPANCRRRVENMFTKKIMVDSYERIYKNCISNYIAAK